MVSRKDRFRHYLNPLHVYCRLVSAGISRKTARSLSQWYEKAIYCHTVLGLRSRKKAFILLASSERKRPDRRYANPGVLGKGGGPVYCRSHLLGSQFLF